MSNTILSMLQVAYQKNKVMDSVVHSSHQP